MNQRVDLLIKEGLEKEFFDEILHDTKRMEKLKKEALDLIEKFKYLFFKNHKRIIYTRASPLKNKILIGFSVDFNKGEYFELRFDKRDYRVEWFMKRNVYNNGVIVSAISPNNFIIEFEYDVKYIKNLKINIRNIRCSWKIIN